MLLILAGIRLLEEKRKKKIIIDPLARENGNVIIKEEEIYTTQWAAFVRKYF